MTQLKFGAPGANDLILSLTELIRRCDIPREKFAEFDRLRIEAFSTSLQVYADRAVGYNVDHPSFQEQVYGPLSLASEVFKRARRMAALLSPLRTEPLRKSDLNRIMDQCIDLMNYLSWLYALMALAVGSKGNDVSDDAPDYVGSVMVLAEADATEEPKKPVYTSTATPSAHFDGANLPASFATMDGQ